MSSKIRCCHETLHEYILQAVIYIRDIYIRDFNSKGLYLKKKTIFIFECQCRCQCRDADPEISKWPLQSIQLHLCSKSMKNKPATLMKS